MLNKQALQQKPQSFAFFNKFNTKDSTDMGNKDMGMDMGMDRKDMV